MKIEGKRFKRLREGICNSRETMAGVLAMPFDYYIEVEKNGLVVVPGGFDAWRIRECLTTELKGAYTVKQKQCIQQFLDLIPV